MANGNTPKLAAVVLLLCIGATAYAISKDLGVGASQRHAPAVSETADLPLPDGNLAPEGSQSNESNGPHSSLEPSSPDSSNSADWSDPEETILPEARTIAAVTESERSFSILAVALETAGLTDMLSEEGPFTIFAPTDDAFYALPPGQLEALLQPENRDQLVALLTHHVVEGKVLSSDFRTGDMHTVDDNTLDVSLENSVSVDGAKVVEIDIPASNGVIHAVDSVILPEQVSFTNSSADQSS
ncbi:MAG: fasciclin domain-containing protein [Cyanobacteria bacterium J06597_1]